MQTHITDTGPSTYRLPLPSLRWGAILAGLVVGLSTHALLMMAGAAAGLAAAAGDVGPDGSMPVAAAVWNTVSMIIAAFIGAYIAARSSGLRRTSDGLLHGVVSWGATMVLSLLLATSLTGGMMGTLFSTGAQVGAGAAAGGAGQGAGAGAGVTGDVLANINQGERAEAIALLRDRAGVSEEQASRIVDQALILRGREDQASQTAQSNAEEAMRAGAIASGWLSAAVVLSLLAAIGGGIVGARGTRRPLHESHRTVTVRQEAPPRATVHVP